MKLNSDKAIVLLSGGQDSFTCLYWALKNFSMVHAISFQYGQRHAIELQCAKSLCEKEKVPWSLVDLTFLSQLNSTALTHAEIKIEDNGGLGDLPSTFVPGRNILFLSVAASWAIPRQIPNLVIGACETDYSGYPDCRENFIKSMENTLCLGLGQELKIHTPLMKLSKAQTFKLAQNLGHLNEVIEYSHTCYEGDRKVRWEWGYGCGECPACKLRKNGYEMFKKEL